LENIAFIRITSRFPYAIEMPKQKNEEKGKQAHGFEFRG